MVHFRSVAKPTSGCTTFTNRVILRMGVLTLGSKTNLDEHVVEGGPINGNLPHESRPWYTCIATRTCDSVTGNLPPICSPTYGVPLALAQCPKFKLHQIRHTELQAAFFRYRWVGGTLGLGTLQRQKMGSKMASYG